MIFSIILVFLHLSCDVVTTNIEDQGTNPVDPDDPTYEPPDVTIVTGPREGETILNDNITIKLSGNIEDCQYNYQLDENPWSGWQNESIIKIDNLNEGEHIFKVKARYTTGEEMDTPLTISFYVDAIKGPSLWIKDKKSEIAKDESFYIEVIAEEVKNLAMASIGLEFNPEYLKVINCSPATESELLKDHQLIHINNWKNQDGLLSAYLGLQSDESQSLSGSGAIFIIQIQAKKPGQTSINFGGGCCFRDYDNKTINIESKSTGLVEID